MRVQTKSYILEDLEKKHEEYKEQRENWCQIRLRDVNTASSKHYFKYQEGKSCVNKTSTALGVELNKEKITTVHNAKEDKGEEVISLN